MKIKPKEKQGCDIQVMGILRMYKGRKSGKVKNFEDRWTEGEVEQRSKEI